MADEQDPKAYVEALLAVHAKYNEFVNGPFRAELGFNGSLDRVSSAFTKPVADYIGMWRFLQFQSRL